MASSVLVYDVWGRVVLNACSISSDEKLNSLLNDDLNLPSSLATKSVKYFSKLSLPPWAALLNASTSFS